MLVMDSLKHLKSYVNLKFWQENGKSYFLPYEFAIVPHLHAIKFDQYVKNFQVVTQLIPELLMLLGHQDMFVCCSIPCTFSNLNLENHLSFIHNQSGHFIYVAIPIHRRNSRTLVESSLEHLGQDAGTLKNDHISFSFVHSMHPQL